MRREEGEAVEEEEEEGERAVEEESGKGVEKHVSKTANTRKAEEKLLP